VRPEPEIIDASSRLRYQRNRPKTAAASRERRNGGLAAPRPKPLIEMPLGESIGALPAAICRHCQPEEPENRNPKSRPGRVSSLSFISARPRHHGAVVRHCPAIMPPRRLSSRHRLLACSARGRQAVRVVHSPAACAKSQAGSFAPLVGRRAHLRSAPACRRPLCSEIAP
jgi:hypothetical protein